MHNKPCIVCQNISHQVFIVLGIYNFVCSMTWEEVDDLEFLPRFFSLEEKCLWATPILLYLEVAQYVHTGLNLPI